MQDAWDAVLNDPRVRLPLAMEASEHVAPDTMWNVSPYVPKEESPPQDARAVSPREIVENLRASLEAGDEAQAIADQINAIAQDPLMTNDPPH